MISDWKLVSAYVSDTTDLLGREQMEREKEEGRRERRSADLKQELTFVLLSTGTGMSRCCSSSSSSSGGSIDSNDSSSKNSNDSNSAFLHSPTLSERLVQEWILCIERE